MNYLDPGAIWMVVSLILSGGIWGFFKVFGGKLKLWFSKKRRVSATPPDKS